MNALEPLFVSPWYWLIGGLIVAGLEILVPGVFLLWIGLGAMIVGLFLVVLPDLSLSAQLLLFAVTMLASIGLGFVLQRRSGHSAGAEAINQELRALVGRRCEAATDFVGGRGRIRLGDTTYGAESAEDIKAGQMVIVFAITNGMLMVTGHEEVAEIAPPA